MLSKRSVRKPFTVLAAVVIVLVLGFVSVTRMTTDLLPDMSFPYVLIMTTDPGASPEEVETAITAPIEAGIATTSNIETISSMSYNSYSVVVAEYAQNTNMDSVLIEIQQKLDTVMGQMADTVGSPMIMQIDPDMLPVFAAAVDVDGMDSVELTDYVTSKLEPQLESIEGVASVTMSGGIEETIQVTLKQEKIDALNAKIQEVISGQFTEAQEELDSAKAELEDGKSQMENGQNALASGMAQGNTEILKQKFNLVETESELNEQLSNLQVMEQLLETMIPQLQSMYDRVQEIQGQIDAAEAQLKLWEAGLSAEDFAAQTGMTVEQAQAMIDGLKAQLEQIRGLAAQVGEMLKKAGIELGSTEDLPAAIAQLSSQLTEVRAGIAAIEEGKAQIEQGKVTLDEALQTLNEQQILGTIQISSSLSALTNGESKLEEAQGTLDTTKEQALKSSDLNAVLSLDTLQGILTAQNFSMPAGYLTEGEDQYLVRVGDSVDSQEELENLTLLDLGLDGIEPIKLSDIADVERVDNSSEVYTKINGNQGLMLSFEKQTGYSTGDVTDRILERFDRLEQEEAGLHLTALMDQGVYIDMIVNSVIQNILVGAALAIFILLLFLRDLRPTLIVACSIPLSVVMAIVLMYFSGVTLNIISLSGLALGIGMLVDNSIVVIENIFRMRGLGYSKKKAAVEGASQVSGAIIASTLTTVCVFAPIIFTDGITRQLFVDLGLTIAYTLFASLLVALTLVPAMASGMLKRSETKEFAFFTRLRNGYGKMLEKLLHWKPVVLILALVLLVLSVVLALSRGTAFMPEMSSTQMTATLTAKEGESLDFEELCAISDEAISRMEAVDGVGTIGAMIGSGSTMSLMGGGGSDSVTMYLLMEDGTKRTDKQVTADILEACADLDCEISIDSSSMDMTALTGTGISINVIGRDLNTLQEIAQDVADQISQVDGISKVDDGLGKTTNEFVVTVDKEKAAKYQMTVAQVFQLVYQKLADDSAATAVSTDVKDYSVYLKTEDQANVTRQDLEELTFTWTDQTTGESEEVPLSEIVTFTNQQGLSVINRKAQNRYLTVSAELADGYNIGLVGEDVKAALADYNCPEGYTLEMTGENETINEAMGQIILMLVLAVVLIYLIMVAQFQSLLSPFIILFTIPLAFTGGFFLLYFSGFEVSIIALIGFVLLAGIIVNNGIVLVDYINQLRKEGKSKKEAIVEAGQTRLRPVLMTALTTIISMSTLALGMGQGSEMMQPMAIVTVGGLIYGTLLTLIVIPCIYDLFHREKNMVEEDL
ncbi:MAG: efflux RND transporter permease subunit [Cuneatibacter sp.]|nr:efflux RND transporter permease subunit [Cuneatibacter sp.]